MIKKLTLVSVVAVLCLVNKAIAQNLEIVPFQIGERVPDLPLKALINYKDSARSLSQFGNKILILDFWDTHCTSCIKMFPLEDSLQSLFPNDIQFLLVTADSEMKVEAFLEKYNSIRERPLSLPIVTGDRLLNKLFRFSYIPHYVWIAPNGQILAETNDWFITKESISNTLLPIRAEEQRLKGNKYADINLKMKQPSSDVLKILSIDKN